MKTLALVAALAFGAGKPTALNLTLNSNSKDAIEVLVDGKKCADGTGVHLVPLKPGKHLLRVVKGLDATEEEFDLKAGQTLNKVLDFN